MNHPLITSTAPVQRGATPLCWVGMLVIGLMLAMEISGIIRAEPVETPAALEYEVKGAFLVKFGMFVEWSSNAPAGGDKAVFTIGILGADPFGPRYDELVSKEKVGGRRIQIKRAQTPSELSKCQIVFISASESARMSAVLEALAGKGVLTVSDEPGFASRGGMIGFVKEGGKVRFEINTRAAELAGLKVSSKLLQVGKRVAGATPVQG